MIEWFLSLPLFWKIVLIAYFAINICLLLWRRRDDEPYGLGIAEGIFWFFLGLPFILFGLPADDAWTKLHES